MNNKVDLVKITLKSFWKYRIHGTRGMISLFLAFLMTPTLSIMLLLTETSRYQSAIELMNELIDCSMLSAQANYDSYLDERFGLLSYDQQERNPDDLFTEYMEKNAGALGKAVTMGRVSGKGRLPLSNDDAFEQQLSEYAGVTGFLEAGTSALNVQDFIDMLVADNPLTQLKNFANATENAAKSLKSVADLVDAIKESVDSVNDYQSKKNTYNDKASDFREKSKAYIDKLDAAVQGLGPNDSYDSIYSNQDVIDAENEAEEARKSYKKAGEELSSSIEAARKKLIKVTAMATSAANSIEATKTSIDELKNYGADTEVLSGSITKLADDILACLGSVAEENWSDLVVAEISKIDNQVYYIKHTEFGKDNGDTETHYINESVDYDGEWFTGNYNAKSLSAIPNNLVDSLLKVASSFVGKNDISDDDKADITGIIDLIGNMAGVSLLYDNHLNAVVSKSADTLGISAQSFIAALDVFIDAANNITGKDNKVEGPLRPLIRVVQIIWGLVEILGAIGLLILSIVAIAGEFLYHIGQTVLGNSSAYYGLLMSCYSVYNCPNRTTWDSGSSLSGFDYKDIYNMVGPGPNSGTSGAFANLGNLMAASESYAGTSADSADAFRGAEAEYILVGTNSEITNQVVTALYIYVFRFLMDFNLILKDQTLSAAVGVFGEPWATIIKVVFMICEAMIDAFMLVNGGEIALKKDKAYLSLEGAKDLSDDLGSILKAAGANAMKENGSDIASMANLGEGTEKDIGNAIKKKFNADLTKEKKPLKERFSKFATGFKFDYSDYLFFLMILTRNEGELCDRLQDVVSMEATAYYDQDFTLDKSFTALEGSVEYELNGMFKLDRLNDGNPYKVKLRRTATY